MKVQLMAVALAGMLGSGPAMAADLRFEYLKDNPKDLNEGRMTLAWTALMIAYPCK